MRRLLVVLVTFFTVLPVAAADNLQCIQQPKRVNACPHLLYRSAQLPDMAKTDVICICVADFYPLLAQPQTEAEQIQYNMTRRQYAVTFGAKLQSVLDILQRRN